MAKKWVALGGGGYDLAAVARGWALDYGVMAGIDWPNEIPRKFREQYGIPQLRDGSSPIDVATRRQARTFAEATVAKVKRLIFQIHGIA